MATAAAKEGVRPAWPTALVPLVAVVLLVAVFFVIDPIGQLGETPPVESVAVERTVFRKNNIELHVRNDGRDPVTIAQVLVDDAYWAFEMQDQTLDRLETGTMTVDYPWDVGLPLTVTFVTSTGFTIDHHIEAAALTPEPGAHAFLIYTLLGLYIGVIPVAIGLLWFPALRRASARWLAFFLAFTVGLLAFLLVDTVAEGFELAAETAGVLNGLGLFAIGLLLSVLALFYVEDLLDRGRARASRGLVLAYLIALGIGLHNLGEGLAVGAAVAAGALALGRFLVLGFALHNTTEGLAIVAPLGGEDRRPSLRHFVALGALAGAPTIAGAWLGGFAFSPAWAALAFGVAAGAIAQVIWTIARSMTGEGRLSSGYGSLGFALGLLVMYVTGLFTA